MEDKFSDIMLTKYRKNVDGTLERLDEYSFSVYFNSGEGKRIFSKITLSLGGCLACPRSVLSWSSLVHFNLFLHTIILMSL